MRKIISFMAILVIGVGLFTGCASNGTGNGDLSRLKAIARLAAFDGTVLWLKAHPEQRPAFVLAHQSLTDLTANPDGKITPADLLVVLNQLPIDELKGPNGSLIFGNAVILFDEFFKDGVSVDSTQVLPVAVAIRDGLGQGLAR